MARSDTVTARSTVARTMAVPAGQVVAETARADRGQGVVTILLWAMAALYAALFIYLEWARYHGLLMHAEDMGNMEQAVWNTAHGHPFRFNNLRIGTMGVEAAGTTTRLSFHVEPTLLLVAIPYLFYASPLNLIVVQTLVVASGVFPAAWLARRYLRLPLAQVAFPLAYLLSPALEAANLYEFHAVTLSAALLLWAFYFADGRRYVLFGVFAALAMGTKEEIGLIVAVMALWIWRRHRERTLGLTVAILSVGWSLFCILVIMRHFGPHGHSSPYCARFNPYLINGRTTDPSSRVTTCAGVAKIWLQHPDQVLSILVMTQKLGFLHRMLMPEGYLSLLSPLTLAISLPSYAIIMFSNDVHMYSGLGHYPAELVPILIAAAIVGTAWLAHRVAPRLRIPPATVTIVACLWLLVASVANQRVNGFTPLYEGFAWPQTSAHAEIGHRILALIPRDAAVSAGDYLNDQLSDRANIYLFPDTNDAQYTVVDASRDNFPVNPSGEMGYIESRMLSDGSWGIVRAEDGYLLLERRKPNPAHPGMGYDAGLPTTLPAAFYTFVRPATPPHIMHPMVVNFGPSLQLLGYDVERREQVNLRQPDVLLTTYWRLSAPVTTSITPVVYLTNGAGAIDVLATDHPGSDWLPTNRWPANTILRLSTVPLTVFTNDNGKVDIDLAVYNPATCPDQLAAWRTHNPTAPPSTFGCDLLTDATHRYLPNVRSTPGNVPMEVVAQGTILKLAQVTAHW